MTQIVPMVSCICIFIALCIGGYTDYKTRLIPNGVPLAVLICGIFTALPLWYKITSLVVMAMVLFISSKITGLSSGGGDIKVYLALCFAVGLFAMAPILIMLAIAPHIASFLLKAKHTRKMRFPAITFMGPIYAVWFISMQILAFGG